MFASTRSKASAAVVLLALLIVPVPLLPPLGLTGKLQSVLGLSWKTAYLVATIGLLVTLCGSLGVVGIALVVRSVKLGHVPVLANAVVPVAACALGVVIGLLFRQLRLRQTCCLVRMI